MHATPLPRRDVVSQVRNARREAKLPLFRVTLNRPAMSAVSIALAGPSEELESHLALWLIPRNAVVRMTY